jgi:hypothetical protein
MGVGVELVLSGVAQVYCVHDREKRQVPDEATALRVARDAGLNIKSTHRIVYQTCACCANVFATFDREPRLCYGCERPLVHAPGGPLPEPTEEVIH